MNVIIRRKKTQGFTLVEIIVATGILALVALFLAAFMANSASGLFWASNKVKITNDVRNFTASITNETLEARVAYVYPSFKKSDRDAANDRQPPSKTSNTSVGDCLVLVHFNLYSVGGDLLPHYDKLVVYYREGDADNLSPVYRAEAVLSTPVLMQGSLYNQLEDLIDANFGSTPSGHPIVLELSRGLADGNLFRNTGKKTVVINGELIHGNKYKELTNTYNLTISPRG